MNPRLVLGVACLGLAMPSGGDLPPTVPKQSVQWLGMPDAKRQRPRLKDFHPKPPDRFDHLPIKRRTTPRVPPSIPRQHEDEACDVDGFATKSGQALSDHIRAMDYTCVDVLFSDAPERTRIAAFSMRNMIDIAQATSALMETYEGRNAPNHLYSKHYLFLRIGYYNLDGDIADAMDWSDGTNLQAVTEAVLDAVDAFVENDHFLDLTDTHCETAYEIFTMLDGGGIFSPHMGRYLPAMTRWLNAFGLEHSERGEVVSATNIFLSTLYDAHLFASFVAVATEDSDLVAALRDLALRDVLVGTYAELLLGNAGFSLAEFLQYDAAPIHPEVVSGVRAILERYDPSNDQLFGIWLETARAVSYHGKCAEFGICGFERELEAQVLPLTHDCSAIDVRIRAEDLTDEELTAACRSMAQVGNHFHALLNTARRPVANDHNEHLEVIVFANSDSYGTYSNLFFGNDTDNGGIYDEGDPADPNNVAQFFGYVADWLPERRVWNLEHEYVHYLDGRYNVYDGFSLDHNVLWWIEGLAEYVSKQNTNQRAIDLAPSQRHSLYDLFPTTYDHSEDQVYRWTYLAVRFMFERHPEHVSRVVSHLRAGCFAEHEHYLETSIGAAYDEEWFDWLGSVSAAGDFVTTRGVTSYPVDCGIGTGAGSGVDDGPSLPRHVEIWPLEASATVDLSALLQDFDAGVVLSVATSDPSVVEAKLDGNVLTLVAVSEGDALVSMVLNEGGRNETRTLQVGVSAECPSHVCRSWFGGWRLQVFMDAVRRTPPL